MADLTILIEKVTAQTTVVNSIITLLNQIVEQLKQCATDPAKVQEIANALQANTDALSAAVIANTPAE